MSLGRDISVRVVLKGVDQASPSIRKVSRSFKTLRGEAQAVSKSMLAAVKGIKRYAGEIRSPLQFSEGAMRKMRREANKLAVTIPKTNKQFRVFGVTLRTLSAGIQSVIGGLIGFNILSQIAGWIREGIDSFIEFEAESVKLAAQAREAGQDINMLAQIFRTVASAAARDFAVSAQDALTALESLVKAGLSGQEAISALGSAIMMARLESVDFEKASNNLVQVMAQFGISGSEAARVVDALVNASRLGIGAASDFAQGLANCGATAKAMGLSLEDATTWLVVLEKRLGDAREAGTHFNRFLLELYDIADKLGVPIRDINGKLRSTNDIILDVIEASKTLRGDFEALQRRLTGVDTRALKVLFTFTQMKEDFKGLREEVAKQGSTWEAYNAWLKTTQGQSAALASETDRLKRRIIENFKDIQVYLGNIFLPAIDFIFSGLRGSLADLTDDYAGYLESMIEMHLTTRTVTEEMATQTIRAWVDMGRITVAEALKICEHLGLMNEDVMALIQQAQQAGVEVPETFRNISFSIDQTRQRLESLKNSIQGLSSAFGLINMGAQAITGFYDAVLAVEKALGRDVELTEEASQSKQRLGAVSQVLGFITNSLNMVMQALQFHQLGAKEAGDMLLNTFTAMINATEDGIVTQEEFIGILQQLGVDAGNVAGSLHNILINSLKAVKDAIEGNIDSVQNFIASLKKLDGMAVHTYHFHHVITVHEEKGGGGGGGVPTPEEAEKLYKAYTGPHRSFPTLEEVEKLYKAYTAAPHAQHGVRFTREGLYYLHRGEMVLPKNVADWFRRGGIGIGSKVIVQNKIVINNPTVRSEADLDELAEKISRKMVSRLRVMT